MTDERNNKPSGSAASAYAACPGRFNLEKQVPERPSSPYAESGSRIHAYLGGQAGPETLTDEELATAERCRAEYDEIRAALPVQDCEETVLENRYWYDDLFSGQIDRIDFFNQGTTALVVDWKTGRTAQASAAENLQLRAYGVLVKKNYPAIKRMFVAIVQPLAARFTIAEYDEADLAHAEAEIVGIMNAVNDPNAPRNPSPDACKYCSAKAVCPEAGGVARQIVATPVESVPALSNNDLSDFLEKSQVVEDFIEALRAEAKERLKSGQEVPGYKLAAGRTSRSVEAADAATLLTGVLDHNEFTKACKVSLPSLEKIFAEAKGLKAKEAKAELETLLADAITTKTSDQILARAK
jgi:CRISPR/Cas system-associated exonuclease Cas4 (RecB family)